jgi:hypothetical protein
MILVITNHFLLRMGTSQLVSDHYSYNTSRTTIFSKIYNEETLICLYKSYSSLNISWETTGFYFLHLLYAIYYSINFIFKNLRWGTTEFYFLHLLYAIYYSITMHLWTSENISCLSPGDVNPELVLSRWDLLEDNPYRVVCVACLSCDWSWSHT